MKVTFDIIIYFLARLFKKINMAKKRKRKIIMSFIVAFSIYRSASFGAQLPVFWVFKYKTTSMP